MMDRLNLGGHTFTLSPTDEIHVDRIASGWHRHTHATTSKTYITRADGSTQAAGYPSVEAYLAQCARLIVRDMGGRGLGWGIWNGENA